MFLSPRAWHQSARHRGVLHSTRTRIPPPLLTNPHRHVSLQAGENKTGHIQTGPNEGILFIDNVFPLRLQKLLGIPLDASDKAPGLFQNFITSTVAGADPAHVLSSAAKPIKALEVIPRLKEGGAFVKFSHDATTSTSEVETALKEYLRDKNIRPWWSPFRRMRANLVRGRPWVEDMFQLPTSRVKVQFIPSEPGAEAVELSQEQLFAFFRPYGKLGDIGTQPPDSKVLPKFAYLDFASIPKAVMAKNCMHGYLVSEAEGGGVKGTVLRLGYERKVKAHWIRDWIFGHPRIVIPIVAAIIAGITVAVFDPIRTFFVKAHITRSLHIEDNRFYKLIKGYATDFIGTFRRRQDDDAGMEAVWDDRKGNIEQLQTWLMETADTFIIVQGPRGSGKKELVLDQALKDKKYKLVVDCKPIQEARGDSATINAAAAEVGYRPVFSFMNSLNGMIDMAAQGATGVKTGFSETLDSQLAKIWNNTTTALRSIALDSRHKDDKDAQLADDEWLEAHPERRPVVIIDNYLHKSHIDNSLYDKIADWAARLTTANIAHVIFLTNDVSFTKSLSKALPDRVFRQISLSDCSPEVAKKFVITHLDADVEDDPPHKDGSPKKLPSQHRADLNELDTCIDLLGGRLTDLEFLARRIKTGETPTKAVHEIIDQSASEILKMYIFNSDDDSTTRRWTSEQAWLLIKSLADTSTLRYNELLLSDTYKTAGESVLRALEQAELISIAHGPNGRPATIKPGKPVYHSAFKRLVHDRVLASRLDLAILTDLVKIETATIEKVESELLLLSQLNAQPRTLTPRIQYLLAKLAASQEKVERYEGESKALKKVLGEEY
ncbi:escape protein-like protein 2 [Aaosphaeria arxii CBS 175.79]|uniref:Mitochondrial escape protein 2 n=1 Tax=Aaosphaeria arxii CBS 175.79 TaxID=1450172 RepID=A0A6A5XTD3_9PLEO|nr:escape protein-like protein 2 [Aaosphaeria arxii CBS 175.79]KAF2016595.1 escape protein-like protein 2 [Aaosphaeria arxii CBS 175.79]